MPSSSVPSLRLSGSPPSSGRPARTTSVPPLTRRAPAAPVASIALWRMTGRSASGSWVAASASPTSATASRIRCSSPPRRTSRRPPPPVGLFGGLRLGGARRRWAQAIIEATNRASPTVASDGEERPPAGLVDRGGDRSLRRERGEADARAFEQRTKRCSGTSRRPARSSPPRRQEASRRARASPTSREPRLRRRSRGPPCRGAPADSASRSARASSSGTPATTLPTVLSLRRGRRPPCSRASRPGRQVARRPRPGRCLLRRRRSLVPLPRPCPRAPAAPPASARAARPSPSPRPASRRTPRCRRAGTWSGGRPRCRAPGSRRSCPRPRWRR